MSYDEVVNFNKFPANAVRTLVALKDLGRGSTGKAWLCVTLSQPTSAACVLKFDKFYYSVLMYYVSICIYPVY